MYKEPQLEMMNKKSTINYTVNFFSDDMQIHQSKCDFPVENAKLDFTICPLICETRKSGVPYCLDIQGLTNVDIKMTPNKNAFVPKIFNNAMDICKNCHIKHVERE